MAHSVMTFIVELSLALVFAGIFLPIGFTQITNYAANLTGTNNTLWSYLITFAIIGVVLFILTPVLKTTYSLTSKGH